jgi:hypothetical protein
MTYQSAAQGATPDLESDELGMGTTAARLGLFRLRGPFHTKPGPPEEGLSWIPMGPGPSDLRRDLSA